MTAITALLAFQLIFLLGLAAKARWMRLVGFFLLLSIVYHTFFRHSVKLKKEDAQIGLTLVVQCFMASDFLVLTPDPHNSLRKYSDPIHHVRQSFFSRLKWGSLLALNPRGIGWEHGRHQESDDELRMSRIRFVIHKALLLGLCVTGFCLGGYINRTRLSSALNYAISADRFGWRVFAVVVYGVRVIVFCSALHLCVVIPLVMFGVSKPEECPPLFGSFFEAYTVSRFWGRTWHHLLRRLLSSHGEYVAEKLLHLHNDTKSYRIVKYFTVFFISGIIHQLGAYLVSPNPPKTLSGTFLFFLRGHEFRFFLLQPLAIMFESAVRNVLPVAISGRTSKWVGYVWVLCWLSWSVSRYMDGVCLDGLMSDGYYHPMKFEMNPPEMWRALNM
ncbi:toxin biosynthesis protein [Moniliophthora roreri]|uniref:Wax synthase domain-containing protein n=1 Tax=Moniliophthora roreri TaxID=221103 RepID=A0A0W0FNQ1_MONRR|nr:toxin biosynthesis protein [Moniliophthora roreri]